MPQAIHISPIDNVVVALHPIAKGTLVEVDGLAVTALEDIPQGHKMAVKPIKNGENVIKYGFPIGHATADAAPGTWMHTHNVHTNLSGEVEYSYNPAPDLAPLPKVEPETFMGFRRKDGRAAIRNEIWIIPTVGCVNDIAKKMVAAIRIWSPAPSRVCTPSPIPSAAARPATTTHRPASCWLRWCATPMPPPFWCCIWAARICSTISSWRSWASTTTTASSS